MYNKSKRLVSSLVCISPAFISILIWNLLPNEIVFSTLNSFTLNKATAFIALPFLFLILHLFILFMSQFYRATYYKHKTAIAPNYVVAPILSFVFFIAMALFGTN